MTSKSFARRVAVAPLRTEPPWQVFIRDPARKGFYAIVGKTKKTWVCQTETNVDGVRHTHREVVGDCATMGYSDAVKAADLLLAQYRRGVRKAERPSAGVTLREAFERFRETHLLRKGRSAGTVEWYEKAVLKVMARWLDKPLRSITAAMVVDLHSSLGTKDGRRGGLYVANDAAVALRAVWRHARKLDPTLPEHPVGAVDLFPEPRKKRDMSPAQLREWFASWAKITNATRRTLLLMTILTGSRTTAMCTARWSDVRPKERGLHQPLPKGGAAKAFTLPLSRPMVRALRRLREHNKIAYPGSPYLFPSLLAASGHTTVMREKTRDGFQYGHALRASYISRAIAAGVPKTLREMLVNHGGKDSDVHDAYAGWIALTKTLRAAQARISAEILSHAGPEAAALLK